MMTTARADSARRATCGDRELIDHRAVSDKGPRFGAAAAIAQGPTNATTSSIYLYIAGGGTDITLADGLQVVNAFAVGPNTAPPTLTTWKNGGCGTPNVLRIFTSRSSRVRSFICSAVAPTQPAPTRRSQWSVRCSD